MKMDRRIGGREDGQKKKKKNILTASLSYTLVYKRLYIFVQ